MSVSNSCMVLKQQLQSRLHPSCPSTKDVRSTGRLVILCQLVLVPIAGVSSVKHQKHLEILTTIGHTGTLSHTHSSHLTATQPHKHNDICSCSTCRTLGSMLHPHPHTKPGQFFLQYITCHVNTHHHSSHTYTNDSHRNTPLCHIHAHTPCPNISCTNMTHRNTSLSLSLSLSLTNTFAITHKDTQLGN